MILNDIQIKELANKKNMINPFTDKNIHFAKINNIEYPIASHGLQPFGYDIVLSHEIDLHKSSHKVADPKNPSETIEYERLPVKFDETTKSSYVIMPPQSFALGRSVEYLKIPNNIVALVSNKSKYARCGLDASKNTAGQAGWEGNLTIELTNHLQQPLRVYVNEGICQLIFLKGEKPNKIYSGKYQKQVGLVKI